jgi:lysophospholipase L1-like esterase
MGSARPTVVACLGSSTTAGKGEAFDWIGALAERPENQRFRFLNFGVGGDLAYSARQRMQELIACRPDKVVILIGGNDVLSRVFRNARRILVDWKRLPGEPSPEWFRENLVAIVHRLQEETSAALGLVSLPQIGEDPQPTHEVQRTLNLLIEQYSGIICDVARQADAAYIPLYERLHEHIAASPGQAFTDFRFLSLYRDAFRYFVWRQSGDAIAAKNGWQFHVDGVHLNRRGGLLLADLVQEFLDRPCSG